MSWIAVGVGIAAIGAAVSSYSVVAAGENAKENADYNVKVQQNAAIDAQQRGAVAAAEHQDKVRRLIATQGATEAANGLVISSGTPLDIMVDTAGMGKLDALRLLNNAGRDAQGFTDTASLLKVQGNNAMTSGQLNGGAAALGGLASAANGYYKIKNPATQE